MEKLEFNPTIIDYSPNPDKEYIAPGVYKYVDSSEPIHSYIQTRSCYQYQ